MSRFNTGNPLGSGSPLDLDDNAKNMDLAVNSDGDTFQDRLGKSRLTWAGVVKSGTGYPAIAVDAAARAEAAASQVQQDADQIAADAAQQAVADVVAGVDGQVAVAQSAADRAETAANIVVEVAEGKAYFKTEAELLASSPPSNAVAKALDTSKVWFWDATLQNWTDTGLSDLDLANKTTYDMIEGLFGEKADLSALYMFQDAQENIVMIIKNDGDIITPKSSLHGLQSSVDHLSIFGPYLDDSFERVGSDASEQKRLFSFEDPQGNRVLGITSEGALEIGRDGETLSMSSVYSGSSADRLFSKELSSQEYLDLNMQRLLLTNTSTLSPFAGSHKQRFTIAREDDFLGLTITQGEVIDIDTPYYEKGSSTFAGQVVHPYICKLPKTVRGYRYIMVLTPFHSTNDMYENPCVYGSTDCQSFELLTGFDQPLAGLLPTGNYNYNSDPSCAFDHMTGEFVVIYRNTQVVDGQNVSKLFLMRTKDFFSWSEPVELLSVPGILSPTVVFDTGAGVWVMHGESIYTANELEGPWTKQEDLSFPFSMWHQEVRYCGNHYIGIFNDIVVPGGSLRLGISTDGVAWRFSENILPSGSLAPYKATITHEFTDDNHIKFRIIWTSSEKNPNLSEQWRLFSVETNQIEVI